LAEARPALAGGLGAYPGAGAALHLAAVLPDRRAAGPAGRRSALAARPRGGGAARVELSPDRAVLRAALPPGCRRLPALRASDRGAAGWRGRDAVRVGDERRKTKDERRNTKERWNL